MSATAAVSWARGESRLAYERHRPEDSVLYQIVADHWQPFRVEAERADPNGSDLPRFVVDEIEAFLKCGIVAHGFLRVACDGCGASRLVPFACKRRGFCPSCLGRRMADFAAHSRDCVMPHVPVRQWVLTVPFGLRFRLAFDPAASGVALRAFISVISRWLRRRARARRIRGILKTGGVTVTCVRQSRCAAVQIGVLMKGIMRLQTDVPGLSSAELKRAERRLEFALPAGLQDLLRMSNGGRVQRALTVSLPDGTETNICDLESIKQIIGRVEFSGDERRIHFGQDAGGNGFVIDRKGAVYFWNHDDDSFTRLARSMEAFAESLLEEPS